MLGGTWVRIGWPFARKVEASSLMDRCGLASRSGVSCRGVRSGGAMEGYDCQRRRMMNCLGNEK